MNNNEEMQLDELQPEEHTQKVKRRRKIKEKRKKDQMSVTIFGVVVYSVVLILVVVFSYVGFKSGISKLRENRAIAEEARRLEEEAKAKEEEEKARAEAEAEAKAKEEAIAAAENSEEGYQGSVFSSIENVSDPGNAPVNSFIFTRKSLNDDTGKIMDYEVYTHPESGNIVKVTTRENCGDLYEITDYYYDNGKINYISQYRADTDVPVDLSTDKVESRFYFVNDKMVRYIYSENNKAVEYSVDDFDLYGEGTIGQYQYMEEMMLEYSKTVFNNAKALEDYVTISGYVQDETNCPTKDPCKVQLKDSNGREIEVTETNSDGFYSFNVKPDDNTEYQIYIEGREDMIPTTVHGIKVPVGSKKIDVETVYLAYSVYETVYPVQMFAIDAENPSTPVAGAEVRIRYGINAREGDVCISGILGEAGEIMPTLRSGNYTAEITKSGYETCYISFSVKKDHTAVVAHAVQDVPEGGYKAVLSFETTPLDIDLRCFDTYGRNVYRSASDSVGITSAETVSLSALDSGTYTFFASDYTDISGMDMMSYRLSTSYAKMYVYDSEGLEAVYAVPEAHAGIVWRAFEIRNRKIIPVNDYYAYITDSSPFRNK